MPDLKTQIQEDMKSAMRAKETLRLGTIRMLLAAIKQHEIDNKTTIDVTGIINIINKQIKQRRDSINQFKEANRYELAEKEQQELEVLVHYLPEQLDEATINTLIKKAIADADANTIKDMGNVMRILKTQIEGKYDMAEVGKLVKSLLN